MSYQLTPYQEYRDESSILNPKQVEYTRFLKTFQEFSLNNSEKVETISTLTTKTVILKLK